MPVIAALRADGEARAAAMADLANADEDSALLVLIQAAEAQRNDDPAAAIAQFAGLAADAAVPALYRDLAAFKALVIQAETAAPAEVIPGFELLAAPGAPFRTLAQEQIALVHLRAGDTAAALPLLQALMDDAETAFPGPGAGPRP